MVVRQSGWMLLAALVLASSASAMDYPAFRRAAMAYESRMLKDAKTVVITGRRTERWDGETIESTFTEMVKGDKWRRETRSLITYQDGVRRSASPAESGPARVHPAPAADGDRSFGGADSARKQAPPAPPPEKPKAPQAPVTITPPAQKTPPPTPPAPAPQPRVAQPAPPVTPPAATPSPAVTPPVARPTTPPVTKRTVETPKGPATKTAPSPAARRQVRSSQSTKHRSQTANPATAGVAVSAPVGQATYDSDSVITVRVFDGQTLWDETNGNVSQVFSPSEEDLRPPTVPGHDYWRQLARGATTVSGEENRTTRNCVVLENDSVRVWVDRDDYFMVGLEEKRQMDREPVRIRCSGFFRVGDDYTIPGHLDYDLGPARTLSEEISSVDFRADVSDLMFTPTARPSSEERAGEPAQSQDKRPGRRGR